MNRPANLDDFDQLHRLARRRGLDLELTVSNDLTGPEGQERRRLSTLRLVPVPSRRGRQVHGIYAAMGIIDGRVYDTARHLLEQLAISERAR